jgi:hypothetical protein
VDAGFAWDEPAAPAAEPTRAAVEGGLDWDEPAEPTPAGATAEAGFAWDQPVSPEVDPEPEPADADFGWDAAEAPAAQAEEPAAAPSDAAYAWEQPNAPVAEEEPAAYEAPAHAAPDEPRGAAIPAASAVAGAFGEVAGRLESIARALRDDPNGFLHGGADDPLGLLVSGFVLGYLARGGDGAPANS